MSLPDELTCTYVAIFFDYLYTSSQLWLPPYTDAETKEARIPPELTQKISAELRLDENQVLSRLEYLRQNALERLAAQTIFKESGIATIKAKTGGQCALNNNAKRSCK